MRFLASVLYVDRCGDILVFLAMTFFLLLFSLQLLALL